MPVPVPSAAGGGDGGELLAAIRAIESDAALSDQEKARRRQELLGGARTAGAAAEDDDEDNDVLEIVGSNFRCVFCLKLLERTVTARAVYLDLDGMKPRVLSNYLFPSADSF